MNNKKKTNQIAIDILITLVYFALLSSAIQFLM